MARHCTTVASATSGEHAELPGSAADPVIVLDVYRRFASDRRDMNRNTRLFALPPKKT